MLSQLYIQFFEAIDNLEDSSSQQDKAKYTKLSLELAEKINQLEDK